MKRLLTLLAAVCVFLPSPARAQTPTPTPAPSKVLNVPIAFRVQPATSGIPTLKNGTIYFATTGTGVNQTVSLWVGTLAGNKLVLGATGPAGAVGATGLQGVAGVAGTAATVAIGTVTTGAAGSNATVTNAGTSAAAVFNFTLPRGATGLTGDAGATGPSGVIAATAPLTYDSTTKTVAITVATTTAAGSLSATDKTKLDTLLAPLSTAYSTNLGTLALGASGYVDVPLTGTTVNMVALANPPPALVGSLSGWRAAIVTANSVRVYYTVSVAIGAGAQTWVVKVIRNVGD